MSMSAGAQAARSAIVKTLFKRTGGTDHGDLIVHLRVNEQVASPNGGPPESKPRYILLAVTPDNKLWIHKSKRNNNGTFSIGKSWALTELMGLEVASDNSFGITLNHKSYYWQTDDPGDQIEFLVTTVRCFRYHTGHNLRIVGFEVNEPPNAAPPYSVPGPPGAAPIPGRAPAAVPPQPPSVHQSPSQTSNLSASAAPAVAPSSSSSSHSRGHSRGPSLPNSAPDRPQFPPVVSSNGSSSRGPSPQPYASPSQRPAQPPPINRPSSRNQRTTPEPPAPRSLPPSTAESRSRHGSRGSQQMQLGPAPQQQMLNRPVSPAGSTSAYSSSTRTGGGGGGGGGVNTSPRKPPRPTTPPAPRHIRIQTGGSDASSGFRPDSRNGRKMLSDSQPQVKPTLSLPTAEEDAVVDEERQPADEDTPFSAAMPSGLARGLMQPEEDQTLANVEEMLEGFEWRSLSLSASGKDAANIVDAAGSLQNQIEKSLVDELAALEAASIHAIVESDDRVEGVLGHLADSMAELDRLDQMITLYKTQLNIMTDDIDHIEGQNKGLQVELANQRALVAELDQLLDTINIPQSDLQALARESLESQSGIERLERAAVGLYKAVLSMRDKSIGDMAAASERGDDYLRSSSQFCKRLLDFLPVVFQSQAKQVVSDLNRKKAITQLQPHFQLEQYLERYVGLMLFVKEIDDQRYSRICAAYFASTSDLHKTEISGLFNHFRSIVRKPTEDELEANFVAMCRPQAPANPRRKAGSRSKGEQPTGGEAFREALVQISPHIHREQTFVADLLHVTGLESYITFADFMELETYFRRNAANFMASNAGRFKDLRSSMDLMFGFLQQTLAETVDYFIKQDPAQVVGLLMAIDQTIEDCVQANNDFLLRVLEKTGVVCAKALGSLINDQIKAIEQTKLTVKKRKGVVPFIRVFPLFVERLESQLFGADNLPIRDVVDQKYDDIIRAMFESLQHMAKMDQQAAAAAASAEDKDQLNYHIVLIENMSHFNTVVRDLRVPSLAPQMKRAQDIYDENLRQYIKIVLRRPFPRLIDFFSGLEQQLRSTRPTEVQMHSAYTKSSAKKACGSVSNKEMRKGIEALSKRVEKHFTDISSPSAENAAVLSTVWQACADETSRLTSTWQNLIAQCYAETSVALDFSPEDVDGAYKRNKPTAGGA